MSDEMKRSVDLLNKVVRECGGRQPFPSLRESGGEYRVARTEAGGEQVELYVYKDGEIQIHLPERGSSRSLELVDFDNRGALLAAARTTLEHLFKYGFLSPVEPPSRLIGLVLSVVNPRHLAKWKDDFKRYQAKLEGTEDQEAG